MKLFTPLPVPMLAEEITALEYDAEMKHTLIHLADGTTASAPGNLSQSAIPGDFFCIQGETTLLMEQRTMLTRYKCVGETPPLNDLGPQFEDLEPQQKIVRH